MGVLVSIREDVIRHEEASKWDMVYLYPLAALLIPLAVVFGLYELSQQGRKRRARGECIMCGHVHTGALLLSGKDPHAWMEPRECKG